MPQGEVVAEFSQYLEATQFVEKLVRHNFPAGAIAIVGSDLRTVERIRGKLSYSRLAIGGAVTGSWLGLIYGILFTGSTTAATAFEPAQYTGVVQAIVIGAGIGMLFNVIRFSLAKSKRSFVSQSAVVASKYQVQVPAALANQAKEAAAINEA